MYDRAGFPVDATGWTWVQNHPYSVLVEKARSNDPAAVEAREKHTVGTSAYSKRIRSFDVFKRIGSFNMAGELDQATPREWIYETEARTLTRLQA